MPARVFSSQRRRLCLCPCVFFLTSLTRPRCSLPSHSLQPGGFRFISSPAPLSRLTCWSCVTFTQTPPSWVGCGGSGGPAHLGKMAPPRKGDYFHSLWEWRRFWQTVWFEKQNPPLKNERGNSVFSVALSVVLISPTIVCLCSIHLISSKKRKKIV